MLHKILKPYHSNKSNLIRIGPKKDGGYVVDRRVINKSKTIITCGLNDDWEFEKDFQNKNLNSKVIAYDHTVNKEFWIKRFKKDIISLLLFKKIKLYQILDVFKYLSYLKFFKGKNKHYTKKIVSKNKNKNNQITITQAIGNNRNIILKVDIEGDEFKILKEINENFNKINLLIIEFHNLQKNLRKIKNFIKKTKFRNIHINANNYGMLDKNGIPKVIEMTLINPIKFKVNNNRTKRNYPIEGLDFKNYKRGPDIKLEFNE